MQKLDLDQEVNTEHISIVEQILRETRNPKIAAVLALDLMLVGVDTVSTTFFIRIRAQLTRSALFKQRKKSLVIQHC